MKRSIRFFFLISSVFLLLAQSVIANTLSVSVSANEIAIGQPLYLTLMYEGDDPKTFGEPDLSSLQEDFDLVGRQQSFSARQTNEDYQVALKMVYELMPKKTGTFSIPSFYAGNDSYTSAYDIKVVEKGTKVKPETQIRKTQEVSVKKQTKLIPTIGVILFVLGGLLFAIAGTLTLLKTTRKKEEK